MGAEAGFHAHNAAPQRLENRFERQSPELAAQDDFPAEIKSYDVKNVFPDIDADRLQRKLTLRRLGSRLGNDQCRSLSKMGLSLFRPTRFAFRGAAGPSH